MAKIVKYVIVFIVFSCINSVAIKLISYGARTHAAQ